MGNSKHSLCALRRRAGVLADGLEPHLPPDALVCAHCVELVVELFLNLAHPLGLALAALAGVPGDPGLDEVRVRQSGQTGAQPGLVRVVHRELDEGVEGPAGSERGVELEELASRRAERQRLLEQVLVARSGRASLRDSADE